MEEHDSPIASGSNDLPDGFDEQKTYYTNSPRSGWSGDKVESSGSEDVVKSVEFVEVDRERGVVTWTKECGKRM